MPDLIKIKKGVDLKLQGAAEKIYAEKVTPPTYAIKPTDFVGIRLKLAVREGDEVKAGQSILFNKDREDIKITAPVSGEVVEVVRGDKRRLLEVRILADKEIDYIDFGKANPQDCSRDDIIQKLLQSGTWAFIRQRPYNVIANPEHEPRDIFISCFDTAPMAPDADFVVHGQMELFNTGIQALRKLTSGKVHLGLDGRSGNSPFEKVEGVDIHYFKGPHPAGNVGVQIHAVKPINKGERVWTIGSQDVLTIGRLFESGHYQPQRFVALTGSGVKKPRYHKLLLGANLQPIFNENLHEGKLRFISGNVLTGTQISSESYLGFYDTQVSVIPEGGEDQFFGWITPNPNKFSISRTLFHWLAPNRALKLDASMNGEERAYVVTGEYEKVFPFEIYPVQLLKSIMINDIEAMENLGIYEVVEEDMALCEVVCTSKIPVQETLREGLDLMLKELGD